MSETTSLLLAVAAGVAIVAAQTRWLPLGSERNQPPARRAVWAALSLAVIVIVIVAAHGLMPDQPALATVMGAAAALLLMTLLRGRFSSDRRSKGR